MNVAVLTTPRTGSNFLFDIFSQTFAAHRFTEIFKVDVVKRYCEEKEGDGLPSIGDYIQAQQERCSTPDGDFFFKVFFWNYCDLRHSRPFCELIDSSRII
jgi:hypothetical protein